MTVNFHLNFFIDRVDPLSLLSQTDKLVIQKQHDEDILVGLERTNKYMISDAEGKVLYAIFHQSALFDR